MGERRYSAEEVDAAVHALALDGERFAHAQEIVTHAAPGLQQILGEALHAGGFFDQAHEAEVARVAALDPRARPADRRPHARGGGDADRDARGRGGRARTRRRAAPSGTERRRRRERRMSRVNVTYLGHSAVALEFEGTTVLIDPFLTGNPKAAASADDVAADTILLTHGHADHIGDTVPIARRTGATVAAIVELAGELAGDLGDDHDVRDPNLGGTIEFDWGWARQSRRARCCPHGCHGRDRRGCARAFPRHGQRPPARGGRPGESPDGSRCRRRRSKWQSFRAIPRPPAMTAPMRSRSSWPPTRARLLARAGGLQRGSWPFGSCSPAAPPTLVFDEVDAGIGGEAGTAVGRALATLGGRHQVLCVTHPPPGRGLFTPTPKSRCMCRRPRKSSAPSASAELLLDEARVGEVSRMLTGAGESSPHAGAGTEELLNNTRNSRTKAHTKAGQR